MLKEIVRLLLSDCTYKHESVTANGFSLLFAHDRHVCAHVTLPRYAMGTFMCHLNSYAIAVVY